MDCCTPKARDYDSGDSDLLAIMNWNLDGKYSPIHSNVNLPCDDDFLYQFFSNYDLKISKIGKQLTFL